MTKKPSGKPRMFDPETSFQILARRQGGMPRSQALEAADSHLQSLQPEFCDWLDRALQELIDAADALDRDPGSVFLLDDAARLCGRLHDIGATMGYELVTFAAGLAREHFENIKSGAEYRREAIHCHVDAIILGSRGSFRNLSPDDVPEMSSGLRKIAGRTKPTKKS